MGEQGIICTNNAFSQLKRLARRDMASGIVQKANILILLLHAWKALSVKAKVKSKDMLTSYEKSSIWHIAKNQWSVLCLYLKSVSILIQAKRLYIEFAKNTLAWE